MAEVVQDFRDHLRPLQGLPRSLLNRIGTIRRSERVVRRLDPNRLNVHPVSVHDIRPMNNDPGLLEPINDPNESGKVRD